MSNIKLNKDARQALYAIAGVADVTVAAIRHLPEEAGKLRSRIPGPGEAARSYARTYEQLARRGESLVNGIRRSRATRQAAAATRVAISRSKAATTRVRESAKTTQATVKAAGTTARKAAQADAKAVTEGAAKVGDQPVSGTTGDSANRGGRG